MAELTLRLCSGGGGGKATTNLTLPREVLVFNFLQILYHTEKGRVGTTAGEEFPATNR